jgi:hypothetical protein
LGFCSPWLLLGWAGWVAGLLVLGPWFWFLVALGKWG